MKVPFVNIHTHSSPESAEKVWFILNQFPDQWPDKAEETRFSAGLHPWYIESRDKAHAQMESINKALSHKHCMAAGEAGLDKISETDWQLQEDVFSEQVKLSEKHGKPMIIHCVKAYSELLAKRKQLNAEQVWIFHGFSSSLAMARQIIDHGCMLSFGKLLWKEGSKAASVIRKLEPKHWFLETDNEELTIESVYEKAALLTGLQEEALRKVMLDNFHRVFSSR